MKVFVALLTVILLVRPTLAPQITGSTRRGLTFKDIAGVIPPSCEWCHGWEKEARRTGYFMGTYEGLMDGPFRSGRFNKSIVPGDAEHSPFVQYIEGSRQPRMPYGRDALDKETIERIRRWIDDGAKSDERTSPEHVVAMDGVPVSTTKRSFWLSCRAPKDMQNIGLRVKVLDEATRNVVVYGWPQNTAKDINGRWNQWKVEVPEQSMKLPGTVTVSLHVSNGSPTFESGSGQDERELNGVIFILEPARTPDDELAKQKNLRMLPQPEKPPHQTVRFEYVLRAPSDLTLTVKPQGGGAALFQWSDKDLPPQKILNTVWNINSTPGVKTGWYCGRMRCTSRDPAVFQPDLAILFHIVR